MLEVELLDFVFGTHTIAFQFSEIGCRSFTAFRILMHVLDCFLSRIFTYGIINLNSFPGKSRNRMR